MTIANYPTLIQRALQTIAAAAESYVIVMPDGTRLTKGNINPKPVIIEPKRPLRRPLGANQAMAVPFIKDIKAGEVRVIPWEDLEVVFDNDTKEQIRNAIFCAAIKEWGKGNCVTTITSPHGLEVMNASMGVRV